MASSSIESVGNIYGLKDAKNNYLAYVNVTIALTAGGTPVDLSSMVISYNDNNGGHNPDVAINPGGIFDCSQAKLGSGAGTNVQEWCIAQKINYMTGTQTSGTLLDNNAQAIIMVGVPVTATPNANIWINFLPVGGAPLLNREELYLQVLPACGSSTDLPFSHFPKNALKNNHPPSGEIGGQG